MSIDLWLMFIWRRCNIESLVFYQIDECPLYNECFFLYLWRDICRRIRANGLPICHCNNKRYDVTRLPFAGPPPEMNNINYTFSLIPINTQFMMAADKYYLIYKSHSINQSLLTLMYIQSGPTTVFGFFSLAAYQPSHKAPLSLPFPILS